MTQPEEQELHRLCELLGALAKKLPASSPAREGLEKGALALQTCFIHGQKDQIESTYNALHDPATKLTAEQRAHLISLGIDPDE